MSILRYRNSSWSSFPLRAEAQWEVARPISSLQLRGIVFPALAITQFMCCRRLLGFTRNADQSYQMKKVGMNYVDQGTRTSIKNLYYLPLVIKILTTDSILQWSVIWSYKIINNFQTFTCLNAWRSGTPRTINCRRIREDPPRQNRRMWLSVWHFLYFFRKNLVWTLFMSTHPFTSSVKHIHKRMIEQA